LSEQKQPKVPLPTITWLRQFCHTKGMAMAMRFGLHDDVLPVLSGGLLHGVGTAWHRRKWRIGMAY
jgi:hypothetical protein